MCLKHIFAKYCTPKVDPSSAQDGLLTPPPGAYLAEEDLQRWALETNGEPFSDETKEEVTEFFDVTDENNLTLVSHPLLNHILINIVHSFKGFMQLYQLQTENEENETWKDLVSLDLPMGY